MSSDPFKHHRRSIRLKNFDCGQAGEYFVTIIAENRECSLGKIAIGKMRVNTFGEIAALCWQDSPRHFEHVVLDAFVVMPNLLHQITTIDPIAIGAKHSRQSANASPLHASIPNQPRGSQPASPLLASIPNYPPGTQLASVAAMIQNFKSVSTRKINQQRGMRGAPVWQRNYYEHIIRSEKELERIREYITSNPAGWTADSENPGRV